MRNLVPIGRFSRVCRLTVKALRHYDELGLLKPVLVDPHSGYRYYSLEQAEAAETIRVLRALEMPLEEIGAVLREGDGEAACAHLDRHRRRLEERIAGYQQALVALGRLIARQQDGPPLYQVAVKEVAPQVIMRIRERAPQPELVRVIPRALDEVLAYLDGEGVAPAGPVVVVYHDTEEPDADGDVEICEMEIGVPVREPLPGDGRIAASAIGGGPVAWTLHLGPYDELPRAYAALAVWMQERGHREAGPPHEHYLTGPEEAVLAETEICWPIR